MLERLKVDKNRAHGRCGGGCDDDARLRTVFIDHTTTSMTMTNDMPM